MGLFTSRKLNFIISEEEGTISLTEALAGDVGTVTLGNSGTGLWTINSDEQALPREIICDMRYEPVSEAVYQRFNTAAEGRFLPAHLVLFKGTDESKIRVALQYFDYVLVPNKGIKNLPKDFRSRVLSYST